MSPITVSYYSLFFLTAHQMIRVNDIGLTLVDTCWHQAYFEMVLKNAKPAF
jgi:hypothetical protein